MAAMQEFEKSSSRATRMSRASNNIHPSSACSISCIRRRRFPPSFSWPAIIIFGALKGERFFSAYTMTSFSSRLPSSAFSPRVRRSSFLVAGIDLSIGVVMVIST